MSCDTVFLFFSLGFPLYCTHLHVYAFAHTFSLFVLHSAVLVSRLYSAPALHATNTYISSFLHAVFCLKLVANPPKHPPYLNVLSQFPFTHLIYGLPVILGVESRVMRAIIRA